MQELEESSYWMELLVEAQIVSKIKLDDLKSEAEELMAILTTCVKNIKTRTKGK